MPTNNHEQGMGLRLKSATTISAIFFAVIGATYLLFSLSLLAEFKALERARTVKNLERVSQALGVVEADLGSRALDWGHWDESLSFIDGANPQYVDSNLNYEALTPFELKHVIFLRRDGSLLFGAESSPEHSSMVPLRDHVIPALLKHKRFSAFLREAGSSALTGLMMLDGKPAFVAASTVTDSKMQEAPRGFVIFIRELSEKLQSQIAQQTLLHLSFRSREASELFFSIEASSSSIAVSEAPDLITGIGALRDLSGAHIATVEFSQPRDILAQGIATRNSLMLVIALFLVVANGVVLLFVDRTVLKPLARFSRRLDTISKTNDLSLTLPVDRGDEIGRLSRAFNGLIESLRLSYQRIHDARIAAQEATEVKSKFIATVSHELRTPIHSITGMLRILKQQEASETRRGFIDMASSAAFGLLSTINEILDFTKAESGQLSLEVREFDLRKIVENAARNVSSSRSPAYQQVELIVDVAPEVPEVLTGDGYRLEQVLTNLLGNACKFTHDGHVALMVSASCPARDNRLIVTFAVEDSGIGIPEDEVENIFQPFHQGAASTARLYQGSGLGLSIVKQIVDRMGGSISVKSAQHRGTIFTISIPFTCEARSAAAPDAGAVALVVRKGSAADLLASAARRHSRHIEVFNPEKLGEMTSLASRVGAFGRLVLWSPSRNDLAVLANTLAAAKAAAIPVVATTSPEDLALREELAQLSVDGFFDTATALERIIAGTSRPCASDNNEQAAHSSLDSQQVSRCLKVLIADDMPTNCIILQSMLEDAGHSVEVVTNGLDLLNRLRPMAVGDRAAPQFDLVLTDIQMPLMDGNTVVRKLRLLEKDSGRSRRLPIVAVTAHALPDEQQAMRQSGIDSIVTKPVSPAELRRVIMACSGGSSSSATQANSATSVERALMRVVREAYGTPTPGMEILDISGIFERSGHSLRRTRMILKAFVSAYGSPRDALAAAAAQGDMPGASRAAHALKGLLLDVGATAVAEAASRLEQRCKSLAPGDCPQDEVSRLITAIGSIASLVERIAQSLPQG